MGFACGAVGLARLRPVWCFPEQAVIIGRANTHSNLCFPPVANPVRLQDRVVSHPRQPLRLHCVPVQPIHAADLPGSVARNSHPKLFRPRYVLLPSAPKERYSCLNSRQMLLCRSNADRASANPSPSATKCSPVCWTMVGNARLLWEQE
jgi:hypothetical protein